MYHTRLITLIITFLLIASEAVQAQTTAIPDQEFELALIFRGYDVAPPDGVIATSSIDTITVLNVMNPYQITDLTGIEDFAALTSLDCSNNQLTSLDLSQNTALTTLSCSHNQLTSLNLSQNSQLTSLSCDNNQLSTLDLSSLTALNYLNCAYNPLGTLDMSPCVALTWMFCSQTQLTALDVTQNPALYYLRCDDNQLSSIDLSQNNALTILNVGNNQLTTLDVSNLSLLEHFHCYTNNLTTLDVSQNQSLITLNCYQNQLQSLDVSQNTAMTHLDANTNEITSLDLTQNTSLVALDCNTNQLNCLDVTNGINLILLNFRAFNNPNLTCITVDDPVWSSMQWFQIDFNATFSLACSNTCLVGLPEKELTKLSVYPVPATNHLTLDFGAQVINPSVTIRNSLGQVVSRDTYASAELLALPIDLATGLYFVEVSSGRQRVVAPISVL